MAELKEPFHFDREVPVPLIVDTFSRARQRDFTKPVRRRILGIMGCAHEFTPDEDALPVVGEAADGMTPEDVQLAGNIRAATPVGDVDTICDAVLSRCNVAGAEDLKIVDLDPATILLILQAATALWRILSSIRR